MTYTPPIPPSWQLASGSAGHPWLFTDWPGNSYHGHSPSTDIYWVESTDKFSPGSTVSHFNQPATGELVFLTLWTTANKPEDRAILELAVLGGYDPNNDVMWPPMYHPQNHNLRATSISIRPAYIDNTNVPGSGNMFPYRVAVCHVGFQALPYNVNLAPAGGFNPNWTEQRINAVNQAFTSPVGTYEFVSPSYVPAPPMPPDGIEGTQAALGTFYTAGLVYFEMIVHRIPWYSFADDFLQDDFCGTINHSVFFGFDAGTLLLMSADMGDGPWGDMFGEIICNGHLHFIYNPNMWNTSLANDGGWYAIGAADGGAPPLDSENFDDLMNDILPANG